MRTWYVIPGTGVILDQHVTLSLAKLPIIAVIRKALALEMIPTVSTLRCILCSRLGLLLSLQDFNETAKCIQRIISQFIQLFPIRMRLIQLSSHIPESLLPFVPGFGYKFIWRHSCVETSVNYVNISKLYRWHCKLLISPSQKPRLLSTALILWLVLLLMQLKCTGNGLLEKPDMVGFFRGVTNLCRCSYYGELVLLFCH